MAKLFLATLCDDVREEKTGKFSLMGLFDRLIVSDFRAPLPSFFLFAQVGCDAEGEHELVVELKPVDGAAVLRAELKHNVVARSRITGLYHANINLRLEHVVVAGAGNYEFALRSDGAEIGWLPVEVVAAPPRVVH